MKMRQVARSVHSMPCLARCLWSCRQDVNNVPNWDHYVITRFNVRPNAMATGKALDIDWLEDRFALFERFCWPSMRHQTSQRFQWLVMFDVATPEPIRERVLAKSREWPNFRPVFLNPDEDNSARAMLTRYLNGRLPETLLTTRLDNDDGLALDYIESVQRYAEVTEATVIEYPRGFIWHRDRLYLDRQPHNAFTTLIEPLRALGATDFTTIYCGPHPEVEKLGKVVLVSDEPSWLQVVHGGNLENRPRGVRCSMRELEGRFAVAYEQLAISEGRVELALDRLRSSIYMAGYRCLRFFKHVLRS